MSLRLLAGKIAKVGQLNYTPSLQCFGGGKALFQCSFEEETSVILQARTINPRDNRIHFKKRFSRVNAYDPLEVKFIG